MPDRTNFARMTVAVGGAGNVTLAQVAGYPPLRAGASIAYTATDIVTGTWETGTAAFDGAVMSGRTVIESWQQGVGSGTAPLDLPIGAIVVSAVTSQDLASVESRITAVEATTADYVDLAGTSAGDVPVWDAALQAWRAQPRSTASIIIRDSAPENGTEPELTLGLLWPIRIDAVRLKSASGSVTVALSGGALGNTPIVFTGTPVADSTPTTFQAASGNLLAIDDQLKLTYSDAAAPINVVTQIDYTRLLVP